MQLLVLDLDGTLTKSDNLVRFSQFMLFKKGRFRFMLLYPLVLLLRLKLIDNVRFKILIASLILRKMDVKFLERSADEYVRTVNFKNDLNLEVKEFIEAQANSEQFILSANFNFLVKAVANALNIIKFQGIVLNQENGKFTGKITGIIPYGDRKIDVYRQLFASKIYEKTIGMGDSKSDIPLLKYLDEGILVKYDRSTSKTIFSQV